MTPDERAAQLLRWVTNAETTAELMAAKGCVVSATYYLNMSDVYRAQWRRLTAAITTN